MNKRVSQTHHLPEPCNKLSVIFKKLLLKQKIASTLFQNPLNDDNTFIGLIPIKSHTGTIGVLVLTHLDKDQEEAQAQLHLMQPLCTQLGITLTHIAKLFQSQDLQDSLTQRERQTLALLAEGFSTKQIAYELGVKEKTIEIYRHSLRKKIGVESVAELTKFAIRAGLSPL